jgi:hypothetical protein
MQEQIIDFYIYVDPDTREVLAMYMFGGLGTLVRLDGEWEPVNRETDPNIDDLVSNHVVYEVDFDKGPDADTEDVEDNGEFHPLVTAFDEGTITEEMVKQYSELVYDETGRNPELGLD